MKDIILIDAGRGKVEITVQTRDAEAHSRLSRDPEEWAQARAAVQWVVAGALEAPKEKA